MPRKSKKQNSLTATPRNGTAEEEPKGPELLSRLRFRVARGKAIRDKWEREYDVKELEEYFFGRQGVPKGAAIFNHTFATAKVQMPALYYANPKFHVRPKPGRETPSDDRVAAVGEGILAAIADQDNNLDNSARLALQQAFSRIGVLKIIYDPKLEPNPQAGQPMYMTDANSEPMLDEASLRPMADPATGQPMVDPQTGQPVPDPTSIQFVPMRGSDGQPLVEPDEVVTDEAYRWQWIDARNVLLPDDGPDMGRWGWIAELVSVPLEEAKADTRFKPEMRKKLKSNKKLRADTPVPEFGADKETEQFEYYEFWDIRKKRWYCFAEEQPFDDFLLDEPFPDGVEDHPYAILPGFTAITGPEPNAWPYPHMHPWKPIQREYNIRRQQISEGAKRSARKGIYTQGSFNDPDEAMKIMQSPRDMEFAEVADMSQVPQIFQTPDLNQSIYKDVTLLQADWRIITGQTGARLADPDSNTATEASFAERAADVRDADMQQAVEKWLSVAGKKMLQRVKATLTLEMWIKMRGFTDSEFQKFAERVYNIPPEMLFAYPGLKEMFRERFGQDKWQYVTRDSLQFEADVSVAAGSSRPRNLDNERTQMFAFLKILGQFPQIALSRELLSTIARMFDFIPERALDEISALAEKMVMVNANQAGRNQGGANDQTEQPPQSASLAGLMGSLTQ